MKVLALNCASRTAGFAALDDGRIRGSLVLAEVLTRGDALAERIEGLLSDIGWRVRDVEGIGVTRGPGSFTGVRVGLATAQGLGFALDCPVFGLSTLELMSLSFPFAKWPVCTVLDARRGEVYAGLYDCSSGVPRDLFAEAAYSPKALLERLPRDVIVTGEGRHVLLAAAEGGDDHRLMGVDGVPGAGSVSALGAWVTRRLREGDSPERYPPTPIYLRKPEAERRLEETPGEHERGG